MAGKVTLREERCKGCGLCVEACPKGILRLSERFNAGGFNPAEIVDEEACIACGFCARMCPDAVIEVYRADRPGR
ncbi:MAG TPA: 4Fe-4S binding protein [Firmicutes bacterium]|nr:4Fe-4S binding protein [Bacillota bacterium]